MMLVPVPASIPKCEHCGVRPRRHGMFNGKWIKMCEGCIVNFATGHMSSSTTPGMHDLRFTPPLHIGAHPTPPPPSTFNIPPCKICRTRRRMTGRDPATGYHYSICHSQRCRDEWECCQTGCHAPRQIHIKRGGNATWCGNRGCRNI